MTIDRDPADAYARGVAAGELDAGWTADELGRRVQVLAGKAVVANVRPNAGDKRLLAWALDEGLYLYVGRMAPSHQSVRSEWANPYEMDRARQGGDRDEVCDKFAAHLAGRPDLLARLPELRGQVLACWCHPLRCHAHHLADLANGREGQK